MAAPAMDVSLLSAVAALQADYAARIDDDRLEEWPDLFTEDCVYKVIARENFDRGLSLATIFCESRAMLIDRIVSLREANIFPVHYYRHIVSLPHVRSYVDGVIETQTNYAVLQTRNDGATIIYNAGHYLDQVVHTDDGLRFRSKVAVYDTNRIDTLMVKPI